MYKNYVYLIQSQKRLIIVTKQILNNTDYISIADFTSTDITVADKLAKAFCIGYILGNTHSNVVNLIEEFY